MSIQRQAGAEYTAGLPQQVAVRVGEEVRIPLRSLSGAGYLWQAAEVGESGGVAEVKVQTGPVPRQAEPPSNLSALVSLVVTGCQAGSALWRLKLVRPWGAGTVLAGHDVEVKVTR